jgi:TPR repeat protein
MIRKISIFMILVATCQFALADKALDSTMAKAKAGDVQAQYEVALGYYHGKALPQDFKQAVAWYTKAAEQGDANSQYDLGTCYYYGQGIAQDYKKAYVWASLAAGNGQAAAAKSRDMAAEKLTPKQLEEAKVEATALAKKIKPAKPATAAVK